MRIGLDLDGTIVVYDEIFHRQARERLSLPESVPVQKEAIRDWLRARPDGERHWIELQGLVYGPLMEEAAPAPGALEFLAACREAGVEVSVVSHRTPRAVADPAIDLHASARAWLARRGVSERVFLEPTRAEKLARIGAERCVLFVDDLPEVFAEPGFPMGTERWLYAVAEAEDMGPGIHTFSDWSEVLRRVVELQSEEVLAEGVATVLGERPDALSILLRGGNNVVARARVGGREVVAKRYFRHPGDPRDRLATEFAVLSFLWDAGLRSIPEPLGRDDTLGVGVYSLIDGEPLGRAGLQDGLALGELLARLHDLREAPGAAALPDASDAAFGLASYRERLGARLDRIVEGASGLGSYLESELRPVAETVLVEAAARAQELGVRDDDVGPEDRTLSPGDIGFQNALRRPDGTLAFVDFEYGGWDESAHVVASACLPPGLPLPPEHHLPVLRRLVDAFGGGTTLAPRVRVVYPLLALKWSLIVLNEFVPVGRARRRFAGVLDDESARAQLDKSRRLLALAREAALPRSFLEELL